MYYSPRTGGFYLRDLHGDAMPTDAIEITDEEYSALLAGQSTGKRIVPDAAGRPVLADQPAPTAAELAATARTKRDAVLNACEWLATRHRDQTDAGTATTLTAAQYKELLTYRQALRDWPTTTGWPDVALPMPPAWLGA